MTKRRTLKVLKPHRSPVWSRKLNSIPNIQDSLVKDTCSSKQATGQAYSTSTTRSLMAVSPHSDSRHSTDNAWSVKASKALSTDLSPTSAENVELNEDMSYRETIRSVCSFMG